MPLIYDKINRKRLMAVTTEMFSERKSVLEMTAAEARAFFLESSSYVDMLLPEYFDFQPVLDFAFSKISGGKLKSMINSKVLKTNESVNYSIILNKDAGYDWREVKIVHPFLYADLVEKITEEKHWKELLARFDLFESDPNIKCISLPVKSMGEKGDTAETILNWWEELEQASIVKSLEYTYCIRTDITNCYGSIYTHTIDWALRGKDVAKNSTISGKDRSFAHMLDQTVEKLQCNQTNGIPQGGELFNFIAEIVLGYSDFLLSKKLKDLTSVDWLVVRYRDDYRIFSNSKEVAEKIVKTLADVLSGLNMHFNTNKTGLVSDIIESAIKPDKVYWNSRIPIIMPRLWDGKNFRVNYQLTLQKHLLEIFWLSKKFPNSGSVSKALTSFAKRLDRQKSIDESIMPLVSIVADIVSKNPKAIAQGVGVLSKILLKGHTERGRSAEVVSKITKKLENTPNLEYLDVWLQRLSLLSGSEPVLSGKLCNAVKDHDYSIWNSSFIHAKMELPSIIDEAKIQALRPEISTDVFDVFSDYGA